ncbi:MAG: dTDP-4-dehydrorhamnose 3,5-epimerase family protein [Bacteroidales bacterium]|nr:dTDP-4-dehydrorhamnose 3,5-epimerase family protein [Bacteroidales bacterium]
MKFFEQKLKDVFLIESEPFIDHRGAFRRHFCQQEFADHEINNKVMQANVSENNFAYTLRGFHYQLPPHGEGKTLSCLYGKIYDIVVDLRPDSPTYLEWLSFELSGTNRRSIHVPTGCANAFLTLEDNSIIQYYCSESYHPKSERGIKYNDPLFNFKWPAEPKFISEKDNNHPDYKPVKSR